MDKLIRVDLTHLTVRTEAVPEAWLGLGGRALTSAIVAEEVPPTCHPLGPNNKLVFAPGLLSGTAASTRAASLPGRRARSPAASRRATWAARPPRCSPSWASRP